MMVNCKIKEIKEKKKMKMKVQKKTFEPLVLAKRSSGTNFWDFFNS
jgi:hypothetical protein